MDDAMGTKRMRTESPPISVAAVGCGVVWRHHLQAACASDGFTRVPNTVNPGIFFANVPWKKGPKIKKEVSFELTINFQEVC